MQEAETLLLPPGSSSLVPSPLQHQAQCLQAIQKTNQHFHQHLKAEQLDRKTSQDIVLQLQNDSALLRYLLFASVGANPLSDTPVKISATSPLIDPIPNPNPNPTSPSPLISCAARHSIRCSTPEGAVEPPRAKPNNSANADFQSSINTRDGSLSTNLSSRVFNFEKLFINEITTYISITTGIQSQYFLLYNKICQLEAGNSDTIIGKIPSIKFVFDRKSSPTIIMFQ